DDALPGSDGTQAADAPRVAEQLAFDAEPFLAVFVDDEPRPTLAECGIHVRVPQIEWLEDVPVSVDHVVRPRHRDSLRGQVYFAAAGNGGSLPLSGLSCWMMPVAFTFPTIPSSARSSRPSRHG